jgi:hypothetical protein
MENFFKKLHRAKKVQIFLQGDLMAIKKSNFACVYIWEILANMTQVSDVALGSLVFSILWF